jgi:hypothetical protein
MDSGIGIGGLTRTQPDHEEGGRGETEEVIESHGDLNPKMKE